MSCPTNPQPINWRLPKSDSRRSGKIAGKEDEMDMIDALKLIVARSPRTAEEALRTIVAARNNSPVLQVRYTNVLLRAFDDPAAKFNPEEREQLASVIENASNPMGRPPIYGETMRQTAIWLPVEMIDWLKTQPTSMSEIIRALIKTKMEE